MSAQFEGRRYVLELKQKEDKWKGIFLFIIGTLILASAFYDTFISNLPINQDIKEYT